MAENKFITYNIGTGAQIQNAPIVDGSIYFSTDEQTMYVDHNGERIHICDIVEIDTEEEMKALLAPKSKFYYCKDTGNLWRRLNGEWQIMGGPDALSDTSADLEEQIAELKTEVSTLTAAKTHILHAQYIDNYDLAEETATVSKSCTLLRSVSHITNLCDNSQMIIKVSDSDGNELFKIEKEGSTLKDELVNKIENGDLLLPDGDFINHFYTSVTSGLTFYVFTYNMCANTVFEYVLD